MTPTLIPNPLILRTFQPVFEFIQRLAACITQGLHIYQNLATPAGSKDKDKDQDKNEGKDRIT